MLLLWFALLFMLSRRNYLSWKPKAAMAGIFAVFVAVAVLLPAMPGGEIRVDFLNAEGTSAVLRAENGRSAVIGTGAGRNTADYVVKKWIFAILYHSAFQGGAELNRHKTAG